MPDFSAGLPDVDDATIEAALEGAVVPPLLAALAGILDDQALIPAHLRPDFSVPLDPTAGLSDDQLREARVLAFEALVRLRDGAETVDLPLASDRLRPLLEYLSAGADTEDYGELLREELAWGEDPRAPSWSASELGSDRSFRVAVVGAGMSGIVAAHRLLQAGVEVVVLEKNGEVGGTWLENSYPGCRVDVSNHFYSYSFAQRPDWPEHFSSQPVLLDYFREVADDCGVRPHIRFDTEVEAVELDEASMTWTLSLRTPDGAETLSVDAVVSAVGQLNRPNYPDIEGRSTFAGPAFHSARWDHGVDLRGKRVAVIGTGASAAQFVPAIAPEVEHLTIFQRTPAWFLPTPDYHDPVEPEVLWLFRNVPGYANWYRFWIFWQNVEGLMPAARVDPEWASDEPSVGPMNEFVRQFFQTYLQVELEGRPDLLEKTIPDYPPFSKRFVRDNGAWTTTLKRDDVDLETEAIDAITPAGVRTVDGVEHPFDVLIYGTGFTASDFLMPMRVVGRDGVELHEKWHGDARAFLGVTLPGFPNLFLLYGPNTNIVVNGSITYFSECEVNLVLGCLREVLERGARAVEPRVEAHDAFNERVDAENLCMAWGTATVNSWYRNATGRTAQNWPFSLREYWALTREPQVDDFVFL